MEDQFVDAREQLKVGDGGDLQRSDHVVAQNERERLVRHSLATVQVRCRGRDLQEESLATSVARLDLRDVRRQHVNIGAVRLRTKPNPVFVSPAREPTDEPLNEELRNRLAIIPADASGAVRVLKLRRDFNTTRIGGKAIRALREDRQNPLIQRVAAAPLELDQEVGRVASVDLELEAFVEDAAPFVPPRLRVGKL